MGAAVAVFIHQRPDSVTMRACRLRGGCRIVTDLSQVVKKKQIVDGRRARERERERAVVTVIKRSDRQIKKQT